jgi:hypothetical protein
MVRSLFEEFDGEVELGEGELFYKKIALILDYLRTLPRVRDNKGRSVASISFFVEEEKEIRLREFILYEDSEGNFSIKKGSEKEISLGKLGKEQSFYDIRNTDVFTQAIDNLDLSKTKLKAFRPNLSITQELGNLGLASSFTNAILYAINPFSNRAELKEKLKEVLSLVKEIFNSNIQVETDLKDILKADRVFYTLVNDHIIVNVVRNGKTIQLSNLKKPSPNSENTYAKWYYKLKKEFDNVSEVEATGNYEFKLFPTTKYRFRGFPIKSFFQPSTRIAQDTNYSPFPGVDFDNLSQEEKREIVSKLTKDDLKQLSYR